MKNKVPLFSIVTVCKNAGAVLGGTMESLRQQSWQDHEYIIVDGASDDTTADVVRSYSDLVNTFVSEPDAGIYDAMNKGIRLARGEWIYFLNADDFFADDDVLSRVASVLQHASDVSLVYGDVLMRSPGSERLFRFNWLNSWNLRFEHLCHQVVFARKALFGQIGNFDTRYKINADYDWLLKAFRSGIKTQYLGFTIASYDMTGMSSGNGELKMSERRAICARYLPPPLLAFPLEWAYRAYRKAIRIAKPGSR